MPLLIALLFVTGLAQSNSHTSHVHTDPADTDVEEDDEGNILCRFCGQTIATKDDWIRRKSERAISTSTDEDLGPGRELQLFRNPVKSDFNVATFKSVRPGSIQEEAESHNSHSFFPPHEWRAVRCSRCHTFLGWKFGESPKPKPTEPEPEGSEEGQALISEDEQARAIEHLTGLCLTHPAGWWTYEWCHKKEVRQHHKDGTPASQDWSLGKFDADGRKQRATSVVIRRNQKRRPFISQFFIGGQRCDENGKKRSTEVQFHCCESEAEAPHREYRLVLDDPAVQL